MTQHTSEMEANALIFAEWLGVTRQPGRVMSVLFEARGKVVPQHRLLERLGATATALRCAVFALRKGLPPEACRSKYGAGYRLTAIGLRECREALAEYCSRMQVAA